MEENSNAVAVAVAEAEERSVRKLQVSVLRSLAELDRVRPLWQSWCEQLNADIDFYLLLMAQDSRILRPHVFVLHRDGLPESLVIGRIVRQRMQFKIGYRRLWASKARTLSIIQGGVFGRLTQEGAEAVVTALLDALRSGEADLAALNSIPVDSPLYRAAAAKPGPLSRDFLPVVYPHWRMSLALAAPLEGSHRSKDLSESRRKLRKLFADYPNRVTFRCFGKLADLPRILSDVEEVARKTYHRGLGVGFIDSDENRSCLRFFAEREWLRTYILYVSNEPCAFWLGTVYRGVFYGGAVGYDARYAKYAPGKGVMLSGIEDLRREGISAVDFGIGDAQYKQAFCDQKRNEATMYIFAPTFAGLRLNLLRTPVALIDKLAKRVLDQTALLPKIKKLWRDRARLE